MACMSLPTEVQAIILSEMQPSAMAKFRSIYALEALLAVACKRSILFGGQFKVRPVQTGLHAIFAKYHSASQSAPCLQGNDTQAGRRYEARRQILHPEHSLLQAQNYA